MYNEKEKRDGIIIDVLTDAELAPESTRRLVDWNLARSPHDCWHQMQFLFEIGTRRKNSERLKNDSANREA